MIKLKIIWKMLFSSSHFIVTMKGDRVFHDAKIYDARMLIVIDHFTNVVIHKADEEIALHTVKQILKSKTNDNN